MASQGYKNFTISTLGRSIDRKSLTYRKENEKSMKKNDTLLHSKLNKEVNLLKYHYMFSLYLNDNNKINARGRFYIDVALIVLFIISFVGDNPFEMGAFLGLLSLVLPPVINMTTNYILNEFKLAKNNLYDFLLGIGTFFISLSIVTGILFAVCKFTYSHFDITQKMLIAITTIGLLGAIINLFIMFVGNQKK